MPRVLHIEDDAANRLLVRKILVGAGFSVEEACDGLEGVRMARAQPPDLVLVDLNIPGLNGYEVTLRLRGETSLRDVPIVAITAEGDRSTSLAVGCDGFVQKPINARTFANTLRGFLRGRREEMPADETDGPLRAQSQQIVARLEAKVAELSDANARLLEATRARTAFYRNISHELATPMTPIVGYMKLLADKELGDLNADQTKAVRAMSDCVARLRLLIDNLLDVTGLETGTMLFSAVEFDLTAVIKKAVAQVSDAAAHKQQRLLVDLDRKLPMRGDPGRLTRAVFQLLDNAVKFSPMRGIVGISVSKSGPIYEVRVADTGPGIARSVIHRVSEPFFQGDSSPTRSHGGVGVGLAIADRVARGHGGELVVQSPAEFVIGGVKFGGALCMLRICELPSVRSGNGA